MLLPDPVMAEPRRRRIRGSVTPAPLIEPAQVVYV